MNKRRAGILAATLLASCLIVVYLWAQSSNGNRGGGTGSGTVTSVATTSPITGGTFTTSGTIACATCLTGGAAAAGNAYFSGAGQGVSTDQNITDSGSGGLTFSAGVTHITSTQGSLTGASSPFITHSATWNAAGTAFVDNQVTLTCTASAANSKMFDFTVGGNSLMNWNWGGANCATPHFDLANGASVGVRMSPGNSAISIGNAGAYQVSSTAAATGTIDTCLDRAAAKTFRVDGNSACNDGLGTLQYGLLTSTGNCAAVGTAASPSVASCSAAPAGSFSCATNASGATCQVNTTAVTANSDIMVVQDSSLGTRLGVTCNTANVLSTTLPLIASRTAATSFTINLGTVATNPGCFSYMIVN